VTRPLSGLERAWLTADRMAPPFALTLVIEGEGDTDEARWRAALAQASAANPGCRLRLTGALGWTRWREVEAPPPLTRLVCDWDGRGPAGAPFLAAPLGSRRGAPVEVLLLPGQTPRVVLRVLHALMDGRGVLAFAEDLVRCVNGQPPIGSVAGPQTDEDLARAAGGAPAPAPARAWGSPTGASSGASGGTWARVRVEGRQRQLMPRALAALWTASRAWTDAPLRVEVPVDLRRYAPGLRSTANLSGILALALEGPEAPEVDALAAALAAAVDAGEACGAPLRAAGVRWLPLGLLTRGGLRGAREGLSTGRYEVSATVSTLGRQALSGWGEARFRARRAFVIPPASPGLPLLAVLSGDEEGLEICGAAPAALGDGGRLKGLLERWAEGLRL
jgi:hypothetical protein